MYETMLINKKYWKWQKHTITKMSLKLKLILNMNKIYKSNDSKITLPFMCFSDFSILTLIL